MGPLLVKKLVIVEVYMLVGCLDNSKGNVKAEG